MKKTFRNVFSGVNISQKLIRIYYFPEHILFIVLVYCGLLQLVVFYLLCHCHLYETFPESNTGHLRLIVADNESFQRGIKIILPIMWEMLLYLLM